MKRRATNLILAAMGIVALALASLSSGCASDSSMDASMATIRGVVTDESGKPVRGATVTVTSGYKSVSRFTDQSGQYEIAGLEPGNYEVSATAWGLAWKSQISGEGEVNFMLEQDWDVHRLSTTEWLSFLPEDPVFETNCVNCHSLNPTVDKRGLTARQWRGLIVGMGSSFIIPDLPEARLAYIGALLEKHFGPNSPLPTSEHISRPVISDVVLQATFHEYVIPTKSFTHSITVDSKGNAWFTEYDYNSNKIGRFDINTEEFQEYPVPTEKAAPHTPVVSKDGRLWITMNGSNQLSVLDPETGKFTEYEAPTPGSPQIPAIDSAGNIWYTDSGVNKVVKFDPWTEQFQEYKVPLPKTLPPNSILAVQAAQVGEPMPTNMNNIWTFNYGIAIDSQDKIWFSQFNLGRILQLDPTTGTFLEYPVPGIATIRGLAVDTEDNIWFANFLGHKLGILDPKTGEIRQYQPPTAHASPYGVLVSQDGYIWFSDHPGNHITRFDPVIEEFVEYPIPTHDAVTRFMGEDSEGRIWFAEFWAGKIGFLDPGESSGPGRRNSTVAAASAQ